MNFITQKHVSRRALLKGAGVAMALPILDAMKPALAATTSAAAAALKPPVRMAFTYLPNGVTLPAWTPTAEGAAFEFTRILKPLEPFRNDLFVISGLDCHNGNSLGDGGGDHARAGAAYLTGVHPKKTAGADIHGGVSVDQIAAQSVGAKTRVASLELGCEDSRTVGNCDTGYSCAYTNSISWRTPTMPMPPETNPRVVFERLFGTDDLKVDPATRAKRTALRTSILDLVNERAKRLSANLGPEDQHKLDEYMTGVRDVEKRIQMAQNDTHRFTPDIDKPEGVPVEFADYLKLMFDLQMLAFQADLTRVSTLMIGREGSVRTYGEIGVPDPHHPTSHHRNQPDLIEKISKINTYHATLFAWYVNKLKTTKDGDGTMLDSMMLAYGSGLGDGNSHTHDDLPLVVLGRAGGAWKPGRHIVYPHGTPMNNLFVEMLACMDVNVEHLGDSNGVLKGLSELA